MERRLHRQAHHPRGREPPAVLGRAPCWTLTVSTWVKARFFFLTSKVFLNGRGAFGICFDDSLRVMQTPWQERAPLTMMGSRSREAEWRGCVWKDTNPRCALPALANLNVPAQTGPPLLAASSGAGEVPGTECGLWPGHRLPCASGGVPCPALSDHRGLGTLCVGRILVPTPGMA